MAPVDSAWLVCSIVVILSFVVQRPRRKHGYPKTDFTFLRTPTTPETVVQGSAIHTTCEIILNAPQVGCSNPLEIRPSVPSHTASTLTAAFLHDDHDDSCNRRYADQRTRYDEADMIAS